MLPQTYEKCEKKNTGGSSHVSQTARGEHPPGTLGKERRGGQILSKSATMPLHILFVGTKSREKGGPASRTAPRLLISTQKLHGKTEERR